LIGGKYDINASFSSSETYESLLIGDVVLRSDCITLARELYKDKLKYSILSDEELDSFFPNLSLQEVMDILKE
jgi:hypothetical protein